VANFSSGTVSQFTINPTTGALIANSPATVGAGTNPFAIAVDPTQSYVYVLNFGSANLSEYAIGADGTLSSLAPATVATGNGPNGLAVTATNLYVANYTDGTISQYSTSAGVVSPLAPATVAAGTGTSAIAVNAAGTFAVVANYTAGTVMSFKIGAGGALTTPAASNITIGANNDSVAIDSVNNYVYVGDQFGNQVLQFSVNPATGVLTALTPSTVTIGGNPFSITLASTVGGTFLYAANSANNTVQQIAEGVGGQLSVTSTNNAATLNVPNFFAVDPSGQFAYVTDRGTGPGFGTTVSQFTITPTGGATPGALTPISGSPTATTGTQPTGIATAY
jgi:6-phosphogluconolactonase (cycloisomerase 2 family)